MTQTISSLRINGAWTQLLSDWLDQELLIAPHLRQQLDVLGPTDRIAVQQWEDILTQAATLASDWVSFGVAVGKLVQPRHVGMLGYLVISCRTLGEALAAYHRYESLFYQHQVMQIHSDDGQLRVAWQKQLSTEGIADVVSFTAMMTFLRRLVKEPLHPAEVGFTFAQPEPEQVEVLQQFFACPVTFANDESYVAFPMAFISLPLRYNDHNLQLLLKRQARALLEASPEQDDFIQRVQQVIVRLLPEGCSNLTAVATHLHVSSRTLQRRLTQRGQHWQQLLDETRKVLAQEYFNDTHLTLTDIALLLGFSEQSAFSRAYLQWTGQVPAAARKLFLAKGDVIRH